MPGSIVSVDIIGLNDVTQGKHGKFPAGTSKSRPLEITEEKHSSLQHVCLPGFFPQQLTVQCYYSIIYAFKIICHSVEMVSDIYISACFTNITNSLEVQLNGRGKGFQQRWPAVRSSLSRFFFLHCSSHEHLLLSSVDVGWHLWPVNYLDIRCGHVP